MEKPFKTIDEQISLLKDRGLIFENEEVAKLALTRYGYYEIINGYKRPFLEEDQDESYKANTTFEHIFSLYKLDKTISVYVLSSLEQFEQIFKQALAYVISEEISEDYNKYTMKYHYNTGASHHHRKSGYVYNDRDTLLKSFKKVSKLSQDPYSHYREKHKNIPPWIMIKGLSFGQSIYWYKLSKPIIREKVLARLLGISDDLISFLDEKYKIKQMLGDLLSLYLAYRNLCAHGGRIYNHRSVLHRLRWIPFIYDRNIINVSRREFNNGILRSSVGVVQKTLSIFDNQEPYIDVTSWLDVHISRYLSIYPEDRLMLNHETELSNIKGFD